MSRHTLAFEEMKRRIHWLMRGGDGHCSQRDPQCRRRKTPPPQRKFYQEPQELEFDPPPPPDAGIGTSQGREHTTGPWTSAHHLQIPVAPLPDDAQRVAELAEFLESGGNGPPPPFHSGRHRTARRCRIQR